MVLLKDKAQVMFPKLVELRFRQRSQLRLRNAYTSVAVSKQSAQQMQQGGFSATRFPQQEAMFAATRTEVTKIYLFASRIGVGQVFYLDHL